MDKEKLINKMQNLLQEYDHCASYYGCKTIVDTWEANKLPLINRFREHPNWDEDNYRIVFSTDYTREFEKGALYDYVGKAEEIRNETLIFPNEAKMYGKTFTEVCNEYDLIKDAYDEISYLKRHLGLKSNSIIGDKTIAEWALTFHEVNCHRRAFINNPNIKAWNGTIYVPIDLMERIYKLNEFNNVLLSSMVDSHIVSDELMARVREIYPDIKTGAGTTISKLLRKVMAYYPEMLAWTDNEHSEWYDANGEFHERDREITYDTLLTRLADRISPLYIQRHTVISLNPLDYLTMSFGANWASCHTIDKYNKRGVNNQGFHGEWCSGTLSYMLDSSSVIFYTVDRKYDGTAFETQDKQNRVMFHLHPTGDAMIQGRVYPDGRDGGDNSLAKQFREVMQKVVSDVYHKDNRWSVKKGTCEDITESNGTNYEDYNSYSDCNVSFRVDSGLDRSNTLIQIGHLPIDPDTGYEHSETEFLNADGGMMEPRICYRCDERFDYEEGGYYCSDNDEYYCCYECAERDGLIWCEDDEEFHTEDNCYWDSYSQVYVHGEPELETYDGNYYSSEADAKEDGYVETADGEWHHRDDTFRDSYDGEYYPDDELAVDIDCDHQYASEGHALDDGCVCVDCVGVDCEWYADEDAAREDGCICTYDTEEWFSSEDTAKECGCIYIADEGEWYSSEDAARRAGVLNDTEVA